MEIELNVHTPPVVKIDVNSIESIWGHDFGGSAIQWKVSDSKSLKRRIVSEMPTEIIQKIVAAARASNIDECYVEMFTCPECGINIKRKVLGRTIQYGFSSKPKEPEIKPCPFCGAIPKRDSDVRHINSGDIRVICWSCKATIDRPKSDKNTKDAINRWNKREECTQQ